MASAQPSDKGFEPLVLACDTTQGACSAALYRGGLLAAELQEMRKGHAEALLPIIAALIEKAGVDMAAIDRLAVTHGPGSFTGVRVGLAAMRGLALALDKPLKTYGSFEVMARGAAIKGKMDGEMEGPLLVAVDARRATFYAQGFAADAAPLGPPQAVDAAGALALVTARPLTIIGSGAAQLCDLQPHLHRGAAANWPDAAHLAAMAAADADWDALPPPEPLYLRPPDATLPDAGKAIALAEPAATADAAETT